MLGDFSFGGVSNGRLALGAWLIAGLPLDLRVFTEDDGAMTCGRYGDCRDHISRLDGCFWAAGLRFATMPDLR